MGMPTIVHFDLPADDPERAKKFYEKLFDLMITWKRWRNSAVVFSCQKQLYLAGVILRYALTPRIIHSGCGKKTGT